MAKDRLELYDKYGNKRDVDISTEDVTLDNENGKSLKNKLGEIDNEFAQSVKRVVFNGDTHTINGGSVNIGNQMQADWNESSPSYPAFIKNKPNVVTGIKIGDSGSTITPTNGVITLPENEGGGGSTPDVAMSDTSTNAVQNRVIKAYVDNLIAGLINGAPEALDTLKELADALGDNDDAIAALTNLIAAKANSADLATVAASGSYNDLSNKPTILSQQQVAGMIEDAIEDLPTGDAVSVTTNGDGTFTVHSGGNDYTVNLNHTHPNMAKLIVCEESDLPSTLANDTIYAVTDSGETEIEKLIIHGMEFAGGGGTPSTEPKIVSPIGTQIDFNGESTKTVTVRATNLSEALTIAVTGVTANLQTISANDAANGVQLTLTKGQNFESGTLRIYSSEVDKSWTVIDSQAYQPIAAVKLTGTQWLQTDYVPGPDTEFSMKCKFTENSNTNQSGYSYKYCYFLCCPYDGNKRFSFYNGQAGTNPTDIFGQIEDNTTTPSVAIGSDITLDNSYLNLVKGTSGCTLTFLAGGTTPYNLSLPIKSTSMSQPMAIGYLFSQSAIYGVYDLTIYELIISENGVERRHYVPKTFNGVPGLYDTVTNTFISSETNDELVAIPLT